MQIRRYKMKHCEARRYSEEPVRLVRNTDFTGRDGLLEAVQTGGTGPRRPYPDAPGHPFDASVEPGWNQGQNVQNASVAGNMAHA